MRRNHVTVHKSPDAAEADRERQVRLTTQRLITDLLPWGQNPDRRAYHLDLTGASVEHFWLEGRPSVGTFIDLNTTEPKRQVGALTIMEGTEVRGDSSHWALDAGSKLIGSLFGCR